MAAKSKMTLLMDLSDKLFSSKLDKLQGKFNRKLDRLGDKLGMENATQKLAKGMKIAAIAGGTALATLSYKGVQAAERFDSAFLSIKQLNLNKSEAEIEKFRGNIRDAAFEMGTNLEKSTNAVYDLQSATGLYGDDAIEIFKKVARFSVATGADLNDSMNSTTKAMKAFGLELKDIDDLLESNAKTVQVGITTFDELAKVQTEFAGAASAASQSVDSANKVFGMFTSIAKNADIAANMTKTFFQGLGQEADKIEDELDIKVFDETGSMRQADAILKDISGKFKGMTDREISNAINKIGGPEGLRGALAKVSKGAEDMIATFEGFDASQFSLQEAVENAEGDFGKMKEIFFNRMDVVMSKLGEKLIPMLAKLFDTLTPALSFLNDNFDLLIPVFGTFIGLLGAGAAAMFLLNSAMFANPVVLITAGIGALIALIAVAINKFDEFGAGILALIPGIGWLIIAIRSLGEHWEGIVDAFKGEGILAGLKRIGLFIVDTINKPLIQVLEMLSKIPGLGDLASKGLEKLRALQDNLDTKLGRDKKEEEKQSKDETEQDSLLDKATGGSPNASRPTNLSDNINKTTGAATQAKNIKINIDAMMKGDINVNEGDGRSMDFDEFEERFNEMMLRIVRNAEMS